jgi:hypothetical protein
VGPDQLHGFRAQLARDLHAEHAHEIFDWAEGTPAAPRPWPGLAQAGPGATLEIAVDDQVEAAALAYLRHPARRERARRREISDGDDGGKHQGEAPGARGACTASVRGATPPRSRPPTGTPKTTTWPGAATLVGGSRYCTVAVPLMPFKKCCRQRNWNVPGLAKV